MAQVDHSKKTFEIMKYRVNEEIYFRPCIRGEIYVAYSKFFKCE